MARLPIALFFSASRSKSWSSFVLSRDWARPAVNNARVSKVANNALVFTVFITSRISNYEPNRSKVACIVKHSTSQSQKKTGQESPLFSGLHRRLQPLAQKVLELRSSVQS